MTQYILSGKTEQALRLFEDLITQGEETIKINAILLSQIRLFLQTKFLMKIGYQQANIAETLKIHPYRVKLAMQEVRKFDEKILRRLFDDLVEMDYQIKSGKIERIKLSIICLTNRSAFEELKEEKNNRNKSKKNA